MNQYRIPLTIFDRLSIPNLLPQTSKYETGIVARDLIQKLQISQDEARKVNLKSESVDFERFRERLSSLVVFRQNPMLIEAAMEEAKKCFPESGTSNKKWDTSKDKPKEIEFTELEFGLVKGNLEKLSREEKLPINENSLALYEKFVNAKPIKGK